MKEDIEIDKIETLKNVRTEIGDVSELMSSIKLHGILQPIGLSRSGDKYIVVFGNRRFQAVKKLGWLKIPAENYVLLPDNINAKDFQVYNTVENIIRKDITPIELGKQCYELKKSGMNISEIAVLFSMNNDNVIKYMEIYQNVPDRFRSSIGYGTRGTTKKLNIPVTVASHIVMSRMTKTNTEKLLESAHDDELSTKDVDFVIRAVKRGKSVEEAKSLLKNHFVRTLNFLVDRTTEEKLMQKYNIKKVTHLYAGIIKGKYPQSRKLVV